MNKLKLESPDLVGRNIDALAELFPNCVTEAAGADGKVKRAVNFELLRQMLSGDAVEGEEHYEFTWVGKNKAMAEAFKPIRKTLRPCPAESKDWDTTGNLYIEGDNLEVLKLLQENYLGKVKLIYIDPPYNTGNDFIYRDDFAVSSADYQEQMGMFDEEDNRLFKNTDSNGRFHSDWCSMMYSRLLLARNLLRDDGAVFISIDDNEVHDLLSLCNEVMGEENYIATVAWQRTLTRRNDAKKISAAHEYIIIFARNYANLQIKNESAGDKQRDTYSNRDNDPRGDWLAVPFHAPNIRPNLTYPITLPSGRQVLPPIGRCWSTTPDKYAELLSDNRIYFGRNGDGMPQRKKFWSERGEDEGIVPWTWWSYEFAGENREATKEIKAIFEDATLFNGPKPTKLLIRLMNLIDTKDSIILDFFSGSATTAHATMLLNNEDNGHRKFIMVQLPESCDEKSEAYKAGYKTICDIGKERIRRVGEKIKSENPLTTTDLDVGFRVFKVDSSNMNDVYYAPGDYTQDLLLQMESNIKADRSDLDLLFGCLLEWNLPLSLPHSTRIIDGCTVHSYNHGDLMACFDENIPESVILSIAKEQPLRAVFRDSSFASSPEKINVYERFKMLAPDTDVRVI